MFQRITLFSFLFLTIAALLWSFSLLRVRSHDVTVMKQKIQDEKNTSTASLFSTTHQERKGVVKEIWFTQEDNTRLHYRIFSESSLLTIQPTDHRFDLIEKLENLKCWMQDKLIPPSSSSESMQQLRYFAAQEGIYRYTAQEFLAQSVALSLYRLKGHELPYEMTHSKPFLKGVAQDVSFAVSGKTPQFKAQQFKAELNTFEEKK